MKPAKKRIKAKDTAPLASENISENLHDREFVLKTLQLIPGLVTVYNINTGKYIYVNNVINKLLGYSRKDFLQKGVGFVSSLVHPDDREQLIHNNQQALKKANSTSAQKDRDPIVTFEYRMKHKNGKYRWLHTEGVVFDRDQDGKVLHVMNISLDITKRREAELLVEKKAEEGEKRYKTFVLESNEGIWRFELKKPIPITMSPKKQIAHFFKYAYLAECNDITAKMYGYEKREDIEGALLTNFMIQDDPGNIAYLKAFITSSYRLTNVESHEKDKFGNDKYFSNSLVGIVENGKLIRAWGTQQDITEIKKAQEAKQYFEALVTSSADAIISKTLDGVITSWNKSAGKIFGWKAKEAIGKHITLIIPPELHNEEKMIIATINKGKHIRHYETIRVRKDGKRIAVSLSISPVRDTKGKIIGVSKIARDITDRKKFEDDLQMGEERLRLAIEAGKIGVWDWDIEHNDIQWSERIYDIHKMPKDSTIGTVEDYSQLIYPEDRTEVVEEIKNTIQNKRAFEKEFRILAPDGSIRWVDTSAIVLRNKKGQATRMLGATTDITHRKTTEQQKDEFMGIVSHELKTPVTSLKAYVQVLQLKFAKLKDDKTVTHLAKIDAQINKLTSLISDLLDVTKIEGGKLLFHNDFFYFDELVSEVIEEVQRTTNKHRLIKQGSIKKTVYGDRERLGQVITNFLTNAIKYSPHTDIIVVKSIATSRSVTLSVQDFGLGIAKDKQSQIFDRFYRETGPEEITFPGLGLGLYISAQIIKRQQGTIWVDSEKGKGSIFSFTIPLNSKKNIQKGKEPQKSIKYA